MANKLKDIQIGHSYSHDMIQGFGQHKNREIRIYGDRFAEGEQVIHIKHTGKKILNVWFVFCSYSILSGSFYKCIYNK